MVSLNGHYRGYNLSKNDILRSIKGGFSGAPYARRHLQMAQEAQYVYDLFHRTPKESKWGHRVIAALECIPVAGLLFALIDRVANYFLSSKMQPNEDLLAKDNIEDYALPFSSSISKVPSSMLPQSSYDTEGNIIYQGDGIVDDGDDDDDY